MAVRMISIIVLLVNSLQITAIHSVICESSNYNIVYQ
jgi:hypothetical protein